MESESGKNPVVEAMRELRTRLGISQTDIASLVGATQITILRYEHEATKPALRSLVGYGILALNKGHLDLLAVFRAALLEELGTEVLSVLREPKKVKCIDSGSGIPEQHREIVGAFIEMLERPSGDLDQHIANMVRARIQMRENERPAHGIKLANGEE